MATTKFHAGTPIKIAILAMGGQGGGVLANWLVDMAEHANWWAQTTSVPGVAQRTGATIYYVELLPAEAVEAAGKQPALALMPTPGDVDLVIAAELMEGGRAIQRGLVTPDRTTLITSSHRSFSINEKSAPGRAIADPNKVIDAGNEIAKRFYCFDLQKLAEDAGSVISASLFGAVAGSGVLPFSRTDFEETIRRGRVGVEPSLKAFDLAYDAAQKAPAKPSHLERKEPTTDVPERTANPKLQPLLDDLKENFPQASLPMLVAGLRRTLDYQDLAYAKSYLEHMRHIANLDKQFGGAGENWELTTAAARYIATAMAYDDVIRVADLKTRETRFERVRSEVGARQDQLVFTTEYMHPQVAEICGTMPAGLGRMMQNSKIITSILERFCRKGRFVKTTSLSGYLMLHFIASLRKIRRSTLRHQGEVASLNEWLELIHETVPNDYALAVAIVNCRRLVKGYSDTHARGESKYQRLIAAARKLRGKPNAGVQLNILIEEALADVKGDKLKASLESLELAA